MPCNLSQEQLAEGILANDWKEGASITLKRFFVHFKPFYIRDNNFIGFINEFIEKQAPKFNQLREQLIKCLFLLVKNNQENNYLSVCKAFTTKAELLISEYTTSLATQDPMKKNFIDKIILGWLSPKLKSVGSVVVIIFILFKLRKKSIYY